MKHLLKVLALLALLATVVLPVTAQDEMMSQTAECGAEGYTGNFQSIEAVDELTVRFTLCNPDPAFPSKVAFSAFQIHPSEYLESTGGGGPELFANPVGTGPYMLENWTTGTEIVLTRNEEYWGDAAIEPTVIFRWNADATARLTELQAGTADGIDNVGPGDFEVVESDPNLQLFPREGLNVFYLGFNNTVAPFDNLQVRQAIAYAIDKERIVANFYPPGSSVADQFMPPAIEAGYTPEVEGFQYDPEMARQLLEESGVELPIEVTLNYRDVVRGYLPQPGIVATDIQAQLAEVGINVTIEVMESGAFIDAANAGELGFYMLGWGADYPDATNFLDYHFGAGASPQFGEKFTEITEPLAAAAALADVAERNAIYVEANTAIRDLVPMVPIAHGGSAVAYRGVIGGQPHASPLSNENFSVVEDPDDDNFVWIQNGEPSGIYCADETDGEALRVCEQINEALLGYEIGGTAVVPVLAESYEPNEDLTEWTFTLREGVVFHDGSTLDANDVVMSYVVQWDAANPLHVGRTGDFTYFSALFGGFLNPQPAEDE
jgi:peptide/nickel transport system substrate-binding protein